MKSVSLFFAQHKDAQDNTYSPGSHSKTVQEIRKKIALLKKSPLFFELEPHELETIAVFSDIQLYLKSEHVFEIGTVGKELYIVESGCILIQKQIPDGRTLDIARYIPGEMFGEFDLFLREERKAWATAEEASKLLVFPKKEISAALLIENHPSLFAKILHNYLTLIAGRIRSTNQLISENSLWIQDLKKQVLADKLTGLYNNTYLETELPGLLEKQQTPSCLLFFKPDCFKEINDTLGHEAGDRTLQAIAGKLKQSIRAQDSAVRYIGNELGVWIPDTAIQEAEKLAQDIKDSLESINLSSVLGPTAIQLTFSMGLAQYPLHGSNAAQLIKAAHEAVFTGKEKGGNQICKAGTHHEP